MGLNTCVLKPIQPPPEVFKNGRVDLDDCWGRYYSLEEYPELKAFPEYIHIATYTGLDVRELLFSHGYSPDASFYVDGEWDEDEEYLNMFDGTVIYHEQHAGLKTDAVYYSKVVFVEEIGDLRKGANSLFYEEDRWDGPCILTKEDLEYNFKRYFSKPVEEIPEGININAEEDGSLSLTFGVAEFNLPAEEMQSRFKAEIIDKFIEGDTFVAFC